MCTVHKISVLDTLIRFAVLAMLAFLPPYLGVAVAATGASPGKALRAQVSRRVQLVRGEGRGVST